MNQIKHLPPSGNPPIPNVPSAEVLTDIQISSVLSVLNALQPYLLLTHREIDSGMKAELDGGVPCSAVATFAKACSRLDAMLDDPKRWDGSGASSLYDSIKAHYDSAVKVNEGQVRAVEELRRPSRRLQPKFTTIGTEFVAYWGDTEFPGGLLLGRGATPEAALLDFDAAFNKRTAEQLRFAPAAEERITAAQQPPEIPILKAAAKKKKR